MINRTRRHRSSRKWTKILAALIIATAVYAGYQYQQYSYFISTPVDAENTDETVFTIKKGENIRTIAGNLLDQKLILNKDSFIWYSRLNNLDKQIKTGRFGLNPSLKVPGIFDIITSNKTRQAVVTIPEGSTVVDIDKILANQELGKDGDFVAAVKNFDNYEKYSFLNRDQQSKLIHPLEGYLFPDTYFVSASEFSEEMFISQLLNTFAKKALPEIQQSGRPVSQVVNIAAMVEKEANRDQDRPIVAGIIWKRLDENWMLGIDATLLYLKNDREIDYKDLQEDSPYNTRNKTGLPPGPIANPGLASLKAAAQPEETPYYYYLTSKDGDMVYAKTNAEHVSNKNRYL
jgi:UPF0755 protein